MLLDGPTCQSFDERATGCLVAIMGGDARGVSFLGNDVKLYFALLGCKATGEAGRKSLVFVAHKQPSPRFTHTCTTGVVTHHDSPLSFSRRDRDSLVCHCGQPVFGREERHQFRRGHEGTHQTLSGSCIRFFCPFPKHISVYSVQNASPLTSPCVAGPSPLSASKRISRN